MPVAISKSTGRKLTELVRGRNDGGSLVESLQSSKSMAKEVAIVYNTAPTLIAGLYQGFVVELHAADLTFEPQGGNCYLYEGNHRPLEDEVAYIGIRYGDYAGLPVFVTSAGKQGPPHCFGSSCSSSSSTFSCPPSSSSSSFTSSSSTSSSSSPTIPPCCTDNYWCFTIGDGYCIPAGEYQLVAVGGNNWVASIEGWNVTMSCAYTDGTYTLSFYGPDVGFGTPFAFYSTGGLSCGVGGTFGIHDFQARCCGTFPTFIPITAGICDSSSSSSSSPTEWNCYQCEDWTNGGTVPTGVFYTECNDTNPDGHHLGGGTIQHCTFLSGPYTDASTCAAGCSASSSSSGTTSSSSSSGTTSSSSSSGTTSSSSSSGTSSSSSSGSSGSGCGCSLCDCDAVYVLFFASGCLDGTLFNFFYDHGCVWTTSSGDWTGTLTIEAGPVAIINLSSTSGDQVAYQCDTFSCGGTSHFSKVGETNVDCTMWPNDQDVIFT